LKTFKIKIPIKQFLDHFERSAFIQHLFIGKSKYKDLTDKDFNKLYDPQADFTCEFFEGISDDIPCEINHVTIISVQKDFKGILKRKKKI
jgi:hypothetical protein